MADGEDTASSSSSSSSESSRTFNQYEIEPAGDGDGVGLDGKGAVAGSGAPIIILSGDGAEWRVADKREEEALMIAMEMTGRRMVPSSGGGAGLAGGSQRVMIDINAVPEGDEDALSPPRTARGERGDGVRSPMPVGSPKEPVVLTQEQLEHEQAKKRKRQRQKERREKRTVILRRQLMDSSSGGSGGSGRSPSGEEKSESHSIEEKSARPYDDEPLATAGHGDGGDGKPRTETWKTPASATTVGVPPSLPSSVLDSARSGVPIEGGQVMMPPMALPPSTFMPAKPAHVIGTTGIDAPLPPFPPPPPPPPPGGGRHGHYYDRGFRPSMATSGASSSSSLVAPAPASGLSLTARGIGGFDVPPAPGSPPLSPPGSTPTSGHTHPSRRTILGVSVEHSSDERQGVFGLKNNYHDEFLEDQWQQSDADGGGRPPS